MKRLKILSLVFGLFAMTAVGVPSRMRPIQITDPEGKQVTVTAMGDEHNHFFVDSLGREIEWLPKVDCPKTTPAMKSRRNVEIPSMHSNSFPTVGELPFLVILVEFPDMPFAFSSPFEEFDEMLNQPGYSKYNGCGSVWDYYFQNSCGAFNPQFNVVGPVMMSRGYAYYGGGSDDSAAGLMVLEACRALDGEVDFSVYDIDGDGTVENVYFFYAGKGEADGGDANTIWPHSWTLTEQGRELTLDGVRIDSYACSPELDGSNKPNGIGTFCHEFAHVLGLPDLYASAYTGALHPDKWSLMASGNYNDDGRRPPCFSSYERYELGWLNTRELSYPCSISLESINDSNQACRISTERQNEYFLFENRQKVGWDASLPGHGMLVWHIDYNPNIWDRNVVNNTPSHQYVDIVEANNATSHSQDAGFTFPGANNVTSFTSSTRPALRSWNNVAIDLPITDIRENGGLITFDVAGGKDPVGAVSGLEIINLEMEECTLSWKAASMANAYDVLVYSIDELTPFSFESEVKTTETTISGLWPDRVYIAEVYGKDKYERGEPAKIEIYMPESDFFHRRPEILPETDLDENGFTVNWEAVDEADSYALTVKEVTVVEGEPLSYGFDTRELPPGWAMTSGAWSGVEGYYGENAPSIRLSGSGAAIVSEIFSEDIFSIAFYVRGSAKSTGSTLRIEGIGLDGSKTELAVYSLTPNASIARIVVDMREQRGFAIVLESVESGVVAYVDDIEVILCERTGSILPAWNNFEVGNVTSYHVSELNPSTQYLYYVCPLKSGETGLSSLETYVETPKASGILSAESVDELVNVYNITGTIVRKNVNRISALEGLPNGFYIVGNRKVLKK